jgi:hypothetical protein
MLRLIFITAFKGDKTMKSWCTRLIIATLVVFAPVLYAGENISPAKKTYDEATETAAPKAVVTEKAFEFKQALEGDVVSHGYIIENRGNAPLDVINVRTSCGCTTAPNAQRPKTIAPGKKFELVINGNTRGYGGRTFDKTITVTTNDPDQSKISLTFKGKVARFARIDPRGINLRGAAGENLQGKAIITPEPGYPFKITDMVLEDGLSGNIDADLDQRDGKYYIDVKNRLKKAGRYRGTIILKTDSTLRPELEIFVSGRINKKKS